MFFFVLFLLVGDIYSFHKPKFYKHQSHVLLFNDYENIFGQGEDAGDFIFSMNNSDIFMPKEYNTPDTEINCSIEYLKRLPKQRLVILISILNNILEDGNPRAMTENFKKHSHYGKRSKEPKKKSNNFAVVDTFEYTFKDIGGYQEVKEEMMQCIDMLIDNEKYAGYNIRLPKGMLLEGPPGNGKTLFAKCLSGEYKIPFIEVSGAMFQEKYVGVGATRIRELFDLARSNSPCIVFIDEIDALGRKRSDDGEGSSSERDSTLNELLVSMDGFKPLDGVFVIMATNRAELLDPSLLRPGRIDKSIYIGNPDEETRKSIINIHIKGKPYDMSTISKAFLIDFTNGLSGAEIENLLNESMLLALRNNKKVMNLQHIEKIYDKIITGGDEIHSVKKYTEKDLEVISVHEIGHALAGLSFEDYPKLKKIVINTNSSTMPGFTLFENNKNMNNKVKLFNNMVVLFGGRVAEELIFNVTSTGAQTDFNEIHKIASDMVLKYGYGSSTIYSTGSDNSKNKIDYDIQFLIESAKSKCYNLLNEHKELIIKCSNNLLKNKVIHNEDFIKLIQKYDYMFLKKNDILLS